MYLTSWSQYINEGALQVLLDGITTILHQLIPTNQPDVWWWNLSSDGEFSVGITQAHIDDLMLMGVDVQTK